CALARRDPAPSLLPIIGGRALIGIRCSTDEQLDRYGPDVQREACLRAAEREGLVVTDEDVVVLSQSVTKYRDSATVHLDADFYSAVLTRLQTGQYSAYVTYDMSRLTRSGLLQQLLLEQEIHKHCSRIIYATLPMDAATPEGRLLKSMMAAFTEYRTTMDLVRLAAARKRRAMEGRYTGGTVPLGYRIDPNDRALRSSRATRRHRAADFRDCHPDRR
ncbi:MAG: recombinase family protein, partial [Chloroflexi bacterium]|nr:recombinase family protein [Chloroflexota bacterium]